MSGQYGILVDFTLRSPGAMAAFRQLIDANARQSCLVEPGCLRFDVLVPNGSDDRILLYEIYESSTAFAAHLQAAHYHVFDQASAALVLHKAVREFILVCEGSHAETR